MRRSLEGVIVVFHSAKGDRRSPDRPRYQAGERSAKRARIMDR